jgi:ribonuclease-3
LKEICKKIGYQFKNEQLLTAALTHSSYANENRTESYERLEFLGDSILSFVVSGYLYKNYPNLPEGEMSKLRASIVCERSLEECVRNNGLNGDIILSKGELQTGGRERASIIADVFEAILGAIYIDGGIEPASKFVMDKLGGAISDSYDGEGVWNDYKTRLQEIVQEGDDSVQYHHVRCEGPEHSKVFTVEVRTGARVLASGAGKSKKDAEQDAAKHAIKHIKKK